MTDLEELIPNATYFKRKRVEIKRFIEHGKENGFTDLLIVNEKSKKPSASPYLPTRRGYTMRACFFPQAGFFFCPPRPSRFVHLSSYYFACLGLPHLSDLIYFSLSLFRQTA